MSCECDADSSLGFTDVVKNVCLTILVQYRVSSICVLATLRCVNAFNSDRQGTSVSISEYYEYLQKVCFIVFPLYIDETDVP